MTCRKTCVSVHPILIRSDESPESLLSVKLGFGMEWGGEENGGMGRGGEILGTLCVQMGAHDASVNGS